MGFERKFHHFFETRSTNDEAIRRAKDGGEEGEIFIAESQTAGRGRMGRHWESPPGTNIYISFLVRPPLKPEVTSHLTLVAGAAVHETILPLLPPQRKDELIVKWPNDVYFGNKKIAGVLSESSFSGKDQMDWVVVGIGIDVNSELTEFSREVGQIATSLKIELGKEFDRRELTECLIRVFERRYFEFCAEASEVVSA